MIANEREEAVLAEYVDVRDEVRCDGEMSASVVEKALGGGTESVVALENFLNGIVSERV